MTIHFSPAFDGCVYIDYQAKQINGLFGEVAESTSGLLARLELLAGQSYPESSDGFKEERAAAYQLQLKKEAKPQDSLYKSLQLDKEEVAEEILVWRDTLILAGWNCKVSLPGKLNLISRVEGKGDKIIRLGEADRWLAMSGQTDHLKDKGIFIKVHYPKLLIPALVNKILDRLGAEYLCEGILEEKLQPKNLRVLQFKEQCDVYQWLAATQMENSDTEIAKGSIVACSDERLTQIFRGLHQPDLQGDKTQVSDLHVIQSIFDALDTPQDLVWLDCSGNYGLGDPYIFLSSTETSSLKGLPEPILFPSFQDRLSCYSNLMVHTLNNVRGSVTLCTSTKDNGADLMQHPMISMLLNGKDSDVKAVSPNFFFPTKKPQPIKYFENDPDKRYQLGKDVLISDFNVSYSTLDNMLDSPLNFVIERQAKLSMPSDVEDEATDLGLAAHRTIQLMSKDGTIDLKDMDKYIEQGLEENAPDMLTKEEYRFELDRYRHDTEESIRVLKKIIDDNHLTIVANELHFPAEGKETCLPTYGVTHGQIDMVLQTTKGDFVLFDFKNSHAEKRYTPKLTDNRSLQLTLYRQLFETFAPETDLKRGGKVVAVGYYLIPLQKLYVPNTNKIQIIGDNVAVIEVTADDPTFKDACKYYEDMYSQLIQDLHSGIVTVGGDTYGNPHIVLRNEIR